MDFLVMHRAMFHLLLEDLPELQHYLRGWHTPPTDPHSADDPVPSGAPFPAAWSEGIRLIESDFTAFADDDAFGLFLETDIVPIPGNPTNRDPDQRRAVHNKMHNRWSIEGSPINLGDPKVNLFNARFWRLHGWIDHQWWRFRRARGLSDEDPEYQRQLAEYRRMMSGHGHDHHLMRERAAAADVARPAGFSRFFAF
jgi:hypothetical protein